MRLAIANTYLWLLGFYWYFHLFLNLTGELLRFGDRVFYKDWWNSSEVSAYWRLWNMPVHYWLIVSSLFNKGQRPSRSHSHFVASLHNYQRHIYFPCIRLKMSKTAATLVVFVLSAVMHEVLVSIPFHMARPWSFLGMLLQIPLVALTKCKFCAKVALHPKFLSQ